MGLRLSALPCREVHREQAPSVRALSIIITLIFVIAIIGGIIYLIIPPMIEQFQKLYDILANWMHTSTHTNDLSAWLSEKITENQHQIEQFFKSKDFADALKTAMPKVFSVLGQTANVVISIVASLITLLYTFFILLDYEYLTTNWIRIFPKKNRPFWHELAQDVERELNNYIRGQGLVALCMAIMFCIGFTIMDFPMAISLGILIGILDLIPYMHTFALIPGFSCYAESSRHGSELLAHLRYGCRTLHRRAGHHGYGRDPEDHG